MFESFHQRQAANKKWIVAAIAACGFGLKICRVVLLTDSSGSNVPSEQFNEQIGVSRPPPPPKPGDGWHRIALAGFSLEVPDPITGVGEYAQGHLDGTAHTSFEYLLNWSFGPPPEQSPIVESTQRKLERAGAEVRIVARNTHVTMGGHPGFRTAIVRGDVWDFVYATECDGRLVELVVRGGDAGQRMANSYRCTPDHDNVPGHPRVAVEPRAGWKRDGVQNPTEVRLIDRAIDGMLRAHTILADKNVPVRTTVARYFDGTAYHLDGPVTERGGKLVFSGSINLEDVKWPAKVLAFRCSPTEVAVIIASSPTDAGVIEAASLAATGRCDL